MSPSISTCRHITRNGAMVNFDLGYNSKEQTTFKDFKTMVIQQIIGPWFKGWYDLVPKHSGAGVSKGGAGTLIDSHFGRLFREN